ncbi:MAG: type IV pilus modification protein PilV [Gammaproteobacteria bacterium]|nr:type IV pilus modification protein PilV [Gammaproteobacteria bacterium]
MRRETNPQSGFSLLEVLVAMMVITTGLLGTAALYVTTLKATGQAANRSKAIMHAIDIANRIRANTEAGTDYAIGFDSDITGYNTNCNGTAADPDPANCTASNIARDDVFHWKQSLMAVIDQNENGIADTSETQNNPAGLPNGRGQIEFTGGATLSETDVYLISVSWQDTDDPNGVAEETYQLRMEL